jgi:hypothetical protein
LGGFAFGAEFVAHCSLAGFDAVSGCSRTVLASAPTGVVGRMRAEGLTATDQTGLLITAEQVRAAVAALAVVQQDSPHEIATVSPRRGTVDSPVAEDARVGLIRAVDQALYQAKVACRNTVRASVALMWGRSLATMPLGIRHP